MKCAACNYEYEQGIDDNGKWGVLAGDEEFIQINGHFTITEDYHDNRKVNLCACPKCNMIIK